MHVARVPIFALLLSCLVVSPASAQEGPPGMATIDGNVDASMSLSSDGGTYMYFNKWVGDGVGAPNSYQQFGFRANWLDLDDFGSHIFSETHLFISDHSRTGVNLGGGIRWEYDGGFAGVNGFFDEIDSVAGNTYRQATVGAEYRHDGLDILANGYFLLSDNNANLVAVTDPFGSAFFQGNNIFTLGTGLVERAYEGFDVEAGVPFPGLEPIRMYAGTYWLQDDSNDETWGFRGRAEARVGQGAKLNFVVSDDSVWGTNINFQAEFMFWGESPIRMPYDYSVFSRRHDPVRRTSVVHTNIGSEPVPVVLTNPRTGTPWTVFHVDNTNVGSVTGTFEDRSETLPTGTPLDIILVHRGVGDTFGDPAGNLTMIDFQQLLGEGFAHFIDTVEVGNIQLPASFDDSGTHPTIRPNAANVGDPLVTLANNNRVVALNMLGSTNASIRGGAVDNFFIQRVFATSTSGVVIDNASGLGVIRDSTFDANGFGVGISVTAAGNGPLALDFDDIDNTGGLAGFNVVADGSDVTLDADNITGDNHLSAGFRIAADGNALVADVDNADMTNSGRGFVQDVTNGGSINSDFLNILATGAGNLFEGNVTDTGGGGGELNTQVIDGIFNGSTAGNGIALNLQDATGLASFTSISASGNGIDGLNAIADAGSNYEISVTNSTAILNTDDSIDITSIGTSFVDFFYDPSNSSQNGDNGFEFLVDGGSELEATLIDIDLSNNTRSAVFGETLGGSTTTLDFVRVNMDDSTVGTGLALTVDGASTLDGTFLNSSIRNSGDDNIGLFVTDGSDVDLAFSGTPADSSGDNGLVFVVDDGANGISTLDITVLNGTFDDNPSSNIVGTIFDGSQVAFNFTNVTADNLAPVGGGLNITAINGSSFVSTWTGGSISNTLDDGVQAVLLGAAPGTRVDMTFSGVTIDGNADNGINFDSFGPDSVANLALVNSPVTNNGIHGVTADLFDTTGTFSATDSPFTNNGAAGVGSGFRMFADGASAMNANFDNSDANDNEQHGYHFNMQNNSTINSFFAGNSATATNNGGNGLNFEVLTGSFYTLDLTGGSFSNNGQAFAASGVRGFVDGVGINPSTANVAFDGTLSNNNTLHGFEFLVSNGAFFGGELNTSGANGVLSASNNANSGVRFEATDAGTVAGLLMSGENDFNDNGQGTGADGVDADGTDVDVFVVGVSGNLNNNGGDGADVTIDNVQTAAIDIDGEGVATANDNAGHGFDINVIDTNLVDLTFNGTPVPAFNLGGYTEVNDNGLNGVDVFADNSDVVAPDSATIDGLALSGNTSGIVVDLTNGSDWNLDITNNDASENDVFGIHVSADGGAHTLNISDNTVDENADTNILVQFSGAATGELHIDRNEVDGGALVTVNEGIRIEFSGGSTMNNSTINGNTVQNHGGDGTQLLFDASTVNGLVIGEGNSMDFNSGNGLNFIFTDSPLNNLSITDNPSFSFNGVDGINYDMINSSINNLLIDNNGFNPPPVGPPVSSFDIQVVFGGGLTPSQELIFQQAELRWEQIITGDLPDVGLVDDVVIDASGQIIDGPGGILGQAGPTGLRGGGSFLPFSGIMQFDSDDLANLETSGQLLDVILHEMGHVLGIGTVWTDLNLLNGAGGAEPRFTGPLAEAEYDLRFPGDAIAGVPVENTGGPGTADGHWRESIYNNELMTGFLNAGVNPLSATTIASLDDMGYVVDITQADPFIVSSSLPPGPVIPLGGELPLPPPVIVDHLADPAVVSANPSVMAAEQILQGFQSLTINGVHGIDFNLTNSDLTNAVISNNVIDGHNGGNGIDISNPITAGNAIDVDFIGNTIINNVVGVNIVMGTDGVGLTSTFEGNDISDNLAQGVNLDLSGVTTSTVDFVDNVGFNDNGDAGLNVILAGDAIFTNNRFDGNTITGNDNFGIRQIATVNAQYTWNFGSTSPAGPGNQITGNQNAGFGLEVTDNTIGNVTIRNSIFNNNVAGGNANFFGDGLRVRSAMNSQIRTFDIGDAAVVNTQFNGNAGDGIGIFMIEQSRIPAIFVQNVQAANNGDDGFGIDRRDTAALAEDLNRNGVADAGEDLDGDGLEFARIVSSSFTGNGNADANGHGLEVLLQNAQLGVAEISVADSIFTGNDNGIDLTISNDSVLVFNSSGDTISNNRGHGVDVVTTERASFGDVRFVGGDAVLGVHSTFTTATVNGNAVNGFNFIANNNSVMSIAIEDSADGRTIIDGNANNGIQLVSNQTLNPINLFSLNPLLNTADTHLSVTATDITNRNGVATNDGINVQGNVASTTRVDLDDLVIGAVDGNGDPIPSDIFPGLGGDGIDISTSGSGQLILDVNTAEIHNNGGDAIHVRNTGPTSTSGDERQNMNIALNDVNARFNDDHGFDAIISGNVGGRGVQGDNDPGLVIAINNSEFSDNGAEGIFLETNSAIQQNLLARIANTGDLDNANPPAVDNNDNPPYDPREVEFFTGTRASNFNNARYDGDFFPWNNMYADQVVNLSVLNSVVQNNGVDGATLEHGMRLRVGTNSYLSADVQNVTFGGNALDDFRTESFVSAGNPNNSVDRTGVGSFDDVFLDDTAQLDVRFLANTGDQINVTSLGAFYTNNDPGKQGTFAAPVFDGDGVPGSNTDAYTRGPGAANRRADIFVLDNFSVVEGSNTFIQFGVPQAEVTGLTGFFGPLGANGYSLRTFAGFQDGNFPPPSGAGYIPN